MEVALEPPPLRVPGRDDPCSRGAYFVQLRTELGVQPLVLEREPGGRGDGIDELGLLRERRVVDEYGDRLLRSANHSRGSFGLGWRDLEDASVGVDEGTRGREPVA